MGRPGERRRRAAADAGAAVLRRADRGAGRGLRARRLCHARRCEPRV